MNNPLRAVLACALISTCISAGGIAAYHRWFAVRIAALDSAAYLQKARTDFLKQAISPDELKRRLDRVAALVESRPENVIILTADGVLSKNVEILTP